MATNLYDAVYNPDVLSCLANLSNDEVFTPPEVANEMLDLLPQELFGDPKVKFLDPACKSGIFLREVAKRLLKGLKPIFPDLQERVDHIFKEQLYGIAITELTSYLSRRSLYCSKTANGNYSVAHFDTVDGNLRFKTIQHSWKDGKCIFCGASQSQYDRAPDLETHAYEFIHTIKPEEIFDMKFDVIISNPPYQLSDGGYGKSAEPIYQYFVEQAKKLQPRYLTMIIPARWYSGGKGLNDFRSDMLNDGHIRRLVDYTNSADCFSGVDIAGGVCYFLWDRDHVGLCEYTNNYNGESTTSERALNRHSTFIRYPAGDAIVSKVQEKREPTMDSMVSSRNPFGLTTKTVPSNQGELTLRYNKGTGPFSGNCVPNGKEKIDKWKVMLSYLSAEHAGQPDQNGRFSVLSTIELLPPKCVCTETYLLAGCFDSKEEAVNLRDYLSTKFVRFLVAQVALSQHITKGSFAFVPQQDFSKRWTDVELYAKYGLAEDEVEFVESMIKPMDLRSDA